jgi:hypothetical protein
MNLLPEKFKRELRLEVWRRFLLFFGTYLALISITAVALLFPSLFFLRFQIGEFDRQRGSIEGTTEFKNMIAGKSQVDRINRSFASFNSFVASKPTVTPVLNEIINLLPDDVVLSNLSLQRSSSGKFELKVTGIAGHRDSLSKLIETLEASSISGSDAVVPPNVFKKEIDTPFTLTMDII